MYGGFSRCVYTWQLQNAWLFAATDFNFIAIKICVSVIEVSFVILSLLGDCEC